PDAAAPRPPSPAPRRRISAIFCARSSPCLSSSRRPLAVSSVRRARSWTFWAISFARSRFLVRRRRRISRATAHLALPALELAIDLLELPLALLGQALGLGAAPEQPLQLALGAGQAEDNNADVGVGSGHGR